MENGIAASKKKQWILPAVINVCLALMCCAAFGTYAMTVRADTSVMTEKAQKEQWFELSSDGKQLSVFLRNSMKGYDWRYGSSNEKLMQLHGHQADGSEDGPDTEGIWRLYLKPRDDEDGEVQLTFVCVKDSESASVDTRILKVYIRNGRMLVQEGE